MVSLSALWLPILLSTVTVFIVSALVWMVLPHHKSDWAKLPDEDGIAAKLRAAKLSPGLYTYPFWHENPNDPGLKKKYDDGPVVQIVVSPNGMPNMGKNLILTLTQYLFISLMVAYVASHALNAGAEYPAVFRVAGTVAVIAYIGVIPTYSIWFGRPWKVAVKDILDGVVYGLLTAGFFGWLWPAA